MSAPRPARRGAQRGAALLIAMVLLALVATLASGMVWQQWRAVEVESAERGRVQSAWIVTGALDWARLILREDVRADQQNLQQRNVPAHDHLGESWAVPLEEARLSTFLAADRDNNSEGGPEAFLSGSIVDAQARYNLRNLIDAGKVVPAELAGLERLCTALGLAGDTATTLANALLASASAQAPDAPIPPRRTSDLAWLGLDAATVERLRPYVLVLPRKTAVNLNTAPREVLVAAIDNLDLGTAERLVATRQSKPFRTLADAQAQLPATMVPNPQRANVTSNFFEIRGRMRLDDRVLEERSLVERRNLDIVVLLRERQSQVLADRSQ